MRSGRGEVQITEGILKDGGGGFDSVARARARSNEVAGRKENCPRDALGAGYMRPPGGHRTLLMWHRTRPVTTGLMRREVFKSAYHRTMATGCWP